jgi:hypothetical protein
LGCELCLGLNHISSNILSKLVKHNFYIKNVSVTFIIGGDIAVGTRSITRKDRRADIGFGDN